MKNLPNCKYSSFLKIYVVYLDINQLKTRDYYFSAAIPISPQIPDCVYLQLSSKRAFTDYSKTDKVHITT